MTDRDVFLAALDLADPAARSAYLDRACGPDPEFRARVAGLLAAHEASGAFMAGPAVGGTLSYFFDGDDQPGTRIGPYKLLEQVGQGGFGVVFMAEQMEPVRRKVALKVLKPGMDSNQVVARFEAERQALALMDHPNIARVFDGGATPAGRPYFVMELVRGVPVTDFCDLNRVTVRDRLGLFTRICRAVQHAHQKGVIHRDLKPANVLVTLHDGVPVPKVIDFGVAKAIGQPLTDKTLFTGLAQMVGTPLYMSPEQAEMSGLDVDTRSDIYSLGVLLYELLTGTTPFDRTRFQTVGLDEVRRIIREEEPARPSTRVSTLGPAAVTLSANRGSDPAGLSRLCRGDLDWIVMKALEKDRARRYETPTAFATDIDRYLADEPILACPPSAGYRFRKFTRRHKAGLAAAGLAVGAVAAVMTVLVVSILRISDETTQKDEALGEKDQALVAARENAAAADRQLLESLAHQARADRTSGRVGQRFGALAAIRRAAALRVTPELRAEAAAALLLPDVAVAHEWEGWPAGTVGVSFDDALQQFARLDAAGNLAVYRLVDGREAEVVRLPAHGRPRFSFVRLSPTGRAVAVGHSSDHAYGADAVRIWKIDNPAAPFAIDVAGGLSPWALHFHPDGTRVAIGHPDGMVSVLNLKTHLVERRIDFGSPTAAVAFHPKSGAIAAAGEMAVHLFDPAADDLPRIFAPVPNVQTLAWHPDGHRLAGGGQFHQVHVWDATTGADVVPPMSHPDRGLRVAYNAAGDRLLSVGTSNEAYLWDPTAGRLLLKVPGVVEPQFGRAGDDRLALGMTGTTTRVWRLAPGHEMRVLRRSAAGPTETLVGPVVHPTGRVVAAEVAAESDTRLVFFDLGTGEELAATAFAENLTARPVAYDPTRRQPPPEKGAMMLPADPVGGGWITAGRGGLNFWVSRNRMRVGGAPNFWVVGPPQRLAEGLGSPFAVRATASANADVFAVPLGHTAVVIHRDRPDKPVSLGKDWDLKYAAVSPDGKLVATGSNPNDGRSPPVKVWNADTGDPVRDLPLRDPAAVGFSPDGRFLVTAGPDGTRLWATDDWREVRRVGRGGYAFSPDGRLLALGDTFGVIRLTATETGREVARLAPPEPMEYGPAAFTPDGTKLIATGSGGQALYVFDLRAVRRQLADLQLDWDWPAFDPPPPAGRRFEFWINPGDLKDTGPHPRAVEWYRDQIAQYRQKVAADPDHPRHCNQLAWVLLMAPPPHRDWRAALPLAEKAAGLRPADSGYANTLGLAYYRAGRYRKAINTLRPNVSRHLDVSLGYDLYFLAMCHAQLGEADRARAYYDMAVRWGRTPHLLPPLYLQELTAVRAEAADLLAIDRKPD